MCQTRENRESKSASRKDLNSQYVALLYSCGRIPQSTSKNQFDEQKADGASGKSKTPQGWEDSEIMVSVILLTDETSDCYDKAALLGGLFRKPDARANPEVLTVTNRHVTARGIRQVVFSRLETAENAETDEIRATLAFTEHRPPIIRTEASQAKTPSAKDAAKEGSGQGSADKPKEDSGIIVDVTKDRP